MHTTNLLAIEYLTVNGADPVAQIEAAAAIQPEYLHYLQLCDAPAESPPDSGILAEARGGRLYPGQGGLWLDALPDQIPISIEVPGAMAPDAGVGERTRHAADAMRAYLAGYRARGSSRGADGGL